MKKTFLDFLNKRDENEMIYIGTKNGSGWIVIETAKTISDNLDKIENWLRGNVERMKNNAQVTLDESPAKIVKLQNQIREFEGDRKELTRLKSLLARKETEYVSAFNTRKKTTAQLDTWKRIEDRKVVDIYKHQTDIIGTAVILEGIDNGNLWFKDEKEKDCPIKN